MKSLSRRSGISLLEIMLATVVLAVMAVAVLNYARHPGERVKEQVCKLRCEQLQTLSLQYQKDYGSLPSNNLSELANVRYLGEALPVCPVDGSAYVLDRATGQITAHAHP